MIFLEAHVLDNLVHRPLLHSCELAAQIVLHDRLEDHVLLLLLLVVGVALSHRRLAADLL